MNARIRFDASHARTCAGILLRSLAILATVFSLHAQVGGTISGYVKDPSGAIVPNAVVTAVLTGQSLTRSTVSDSTGFFNLLSLQPGVYDISTASPARRQVQAGARLVG
jgi:hypothetical protein